MAAATGMTRVQRWGVLVAMLVFIAGVVGYGTTWLSGKHEQVRQEKQDAVSTDTGRSGFVGEAPAGRRAEAIEETQPEAQTWQAKAGAVAMKIGLAFLGGFAAGYAARTFVRTAAMVAAVVVVGVILLSYFGLIDVDFSRAERAYNDNAEWLQTQGGKLLDVVAARVPGTLAGLAGVVVGFLRKA